MIWFILRAAWYLQHWLNLERTSFYIHKQRREVEKSVMISIAPKPSFLLSRVPNPGFGGSSSRGESGSTPLPDMIFVKTNIRLMFWGGEITRKATIANVRLQLSFHCHFKGVTFSITIIAVVKSEEIAKQISTCIHFIHNLCFRLLVIFNKKYHVDFWQIYTFDKIFTRLLVAAVAPNINPESTARMESLAAMLIINDFSTFAHSLWI